MKDKIMLFIIGVLVGLVVSTGIFYIYSNNIECTNSTQMPEQPPMMEGQEPPEKPSGQMNDGEVPPEKPSENNLQENN
jgi:hypothetical protein